MGEGGRRGERDVDKEKGRVVERGMDGVREGQKIGRTIKKMFVVYIVDNRVSVCGEWYTRVCECCL